MPSYGGWVGKTLRINLSSGAISSENTVEKYKDYVGGAGLGLKVIWDEVPAGTKGMDEGNKIVFATGPCTGTSAPTGGRTSITTIHPLVYPTELVAHSHMGGYWGPELKFAGWDAIIIEGKADRPVWISIVDDKVEIRDASRLWGSGTYRTTAEICNEMGPEAHVAAIGQAGENLVRMSTVCTDYCHSAGGIGAVLGSKNLKAIGVKGSGQINIASDKKAWRDYVKYVETLMGANNNHVVPSTPQRWAEYYSPSTRWTARKGLFWGAANPPVETGECDPHDINSMGYRTMKAIYDLGPLAEKYTVRMGGCHSCPIRCYSYIDVPSVETKYKGPRTAAQTCIGWHGNSVFKMFPDGPKGLTNIEAAVMGKNLADDYGVFCAYGQLQRDFKWCYDKGFIKDKLSKAEYDAIAWDKFEKGNPEFLFDFYRRIAYRDGELGTTLGEGPGRLSARWNLPQEYYDDHDVLYWKMGHTKHHSNEDGGQVGVLINMLSNRDAMNHSIVNFLRNGLPLKVQKAIGAQLWGSEDAVDAAANWTPMNPYKAKFTKWGLVRQLLHDSLTVCNWVYPLIASPLKERNYVGDNGVEAQMYSLATGDQKSTEELDLAGERMVNLFRALTIRDMGTKEMRTKHDTVPAWVFDYPKDKKPFTPGHDKMDRDDIEKAKDLFYTEMGWDVATGAPTRETYERLGMKEIADGLEAKGLL